MPFGQVVIGPPGSGKTTYCAGVQQYLRAAQRPVALVNLDPANDVLPYTPDIDVCELVCLESVMGELGLGPNGGARRGARHLWQAPGGSQRVASVAHAIAHEGERRSSMREEPALLPPPLLQDALGRRPACQSCGGGHSGRAPSEMWHRGRR
jgi:hypothetical protein